MQLQGFPLCCTATVLTLLGPSDTAGGGGWHRHVDGECNEENFFKAARACMEEAGRRGLATIIAITNSDQRVAMATLPKLGFVLVQEAIGKRNHAEKTLNTYVYTICDADRVPKALAANPFAPAAREQEAAIEGNPFHPAHRAAGAVRPRAERVAVAPEAGDAGLEAGGRAPEVARNAIQRAVAGQRVFLNPPVPQGRNRELEATTFYQAAKAKLAANPEAFPLSWEVIRRNIRIAYEETPDAWEINHVGGIRGKNSMHLQTAFGWRQSPQGFDFWRLLRDAGL